MSQENERSAWAERQHHMITGNLCDACTDPLSLTERVRQERDLRTSCRMVRFPVVSDRHRCSSWRQNGSTEAAERLRWLDRQKRPPRARSRSAVIVDGNEVDGVGQSE